MKLWLSLLLVLAVVSVLEARRGGRGREWRRQKFAALQSGRHGDPIMATDDDIKDDDDESVYKNDWMSKKQRKWNRKRQRKMKWMKKRRGMMTTDDSDEDKTDEVQNSYEDNHSMTHRRRWNASKGNRGQKRQKWRKIKKMKKWMHKRPSCFCLQTEQLEKLRELIKKEGLESTFTMIMPPEEDIPDVDTSDVSDDKDDDLTEDVDDDDFDDSDEDFTDEVTESIYEELPEVTTESLVILE
ncbi:uncharacterized protein DDB_G0283697-like [Saccostrea echinata]|uniref:uncharacterized protein DDB_G0283697-like n=1 Tax=Saccostrea echinata TaxID=191078 RepID=UPI002A80779B|nr:uncharacterized protein DDB_G0283697-like [Saccostrea echinata]XP_061191240.1 uncharacterized protein DDB_G0283697-like [Saccostrea echinata]